MRDLPKTPIADFFCFLAAIFFLWFVFYFDVLEFWGVLDIFDYLLFNK